MDPQDLTPLKSSKFEPERALRTAVGGMSAAPLPAAFFAAAAGGAAYWWMTSWTRRRAETAEPVSFAPPAEEGPIATEADAPEVMAHQPTPDPTPAEDTTTAKLAVEPAEVMEHAPVGAQPAAAEAGPVDLAPVAEALTIEAAAAVEPKIEEPPADLTPVDLAPAKAAARPRRKPAAKPAPQTH